MSELQKRRFPFWLTLSVLGNLVLVGLIAGVLLKTRPGPGHHPDSGRPGAELSREDRDAVRQLMRDSFDAGREAVEARREAERNLVMVLTADPYDASAARTALAELRIADQRARDVVSGQMLEGLGDLSPDQRKLVARLIQGNIDRRGERGERGERLEKFRERREERLRERGEEGP